MYENKVVLGDCLPNLKNIEDNTFDVTFTSPPYADSGNNNDWENYEKRGDKSCCTHKKYISVESYNGEDWLNWQINIIDECLRVSKKMVIYNIGAILNNRVNVYKLIGHYAENLKDDIIWYKPNGLPSSTKGALSNTYEHILLIQKDMKQTIKVNSDFFRNVIVLPTNPNRKYAKIHKAIMNKELSDICIREFTNEGDLVLDPFMGSGTTALSCIDLHRNYYGYEICKEYYDLCQQRINERNMLNDPFDL